MLLTLLNNLAKYENESIWEFHTKFETLLQRIPASHHPKDDYLIHVYTIVLKTETGTGTGRGSNLNRNRN
jgi:hypothetical protein